MSVEATIPAAAAVAVSLAGFLYARYITSKYDREHAVNGGEELLQTMVVDLGDVEEALTSQGVNRGKLSELLGDSRHETIEIPVKIATH